MTNSFRFKQFEIFQENAAMKTGTDGVLLASWADIIGENCLDIGTGTGIISLICAQRNKNLKINALEIDQMAAKDAKLNFENSIFKDRINLIIDDFLLFSQNTPLKFDTIISNPPFFENSMKSPNQSRTMARHTDSLPLSKLAKGISKIISKNGRFSVILPTELWRDFTTYCALSGLHLYKIAQISSKKNNSPLRTMMSFSKEFLPIERQNFYINSPFYIELVKDFYLKM